MPDPINFIPKPITTGRMVPEAGRVKTPNDIDGNQKFGDILNQEISKNDDVKFSAHALKRMQDRNISLTPKDMTDIKQAVDKANDKGIRESLVIMKDVSLIVNIKNKTVVTAVDSKSMKENVITNIDGAVFI